MKIRTLGKKALALVLSAAVLISCLIISGISASAVTIWDGTTVTQPTDDNGDGVFEINTPAEFAWLGLNGGSGNYILTADIYLNDMELSFDGDTPVLKKANGDLITDLSTLNVWEGKYDFKGTIDGNGHTVSGMFNNTELAPGGDSKRGMFGRGINATIKNIRVANTYFAGATYESVFFAYNNASGNVTVDTCYVENVYLAPNLAEVTNSNYPTAGFIAGYIQGASLTVNDCLITDAKINGSFSRIGGVLGDAWLSGGITMNRTLNATYYTSFGGNPASATAYAGTMAGGGNYALTANKGQYCPEVVLVNSSAVIGDSAEIYLWKLGEKFYTTDSYPVQGIFLDEITGNNVQLGEEPTFDPEQEPEHSDVVSYILGDLIYEDDFEDDTVGTLPDGWSYGWPHGTDDTKSNFGWALNASSTATATVVEYGSDGKVIQFGSSNTDAFLVAPSTTTMNYVYEATIVANKASGSELGPANNFYGSIKQATGAFGHSIQPSGTAKYRYFGTGGSTGGEWNPSFVFSAGERIQLKIISLNGYNYTFYNGTHVATAPWRSGAGTSDNPGLYTYGGDMYLTDVKVYGIDTAILDYDASRVVVNKDESVDYVLDFSFDKSQKIYDKYVSGNYAPADNFKFGFAMYVGDEDISKTLTVNTKNAEVVYFAADDITENEDFVYATVKTELEKADYQKWVNARPFVFVGGRYFYGDGRAYTAANLANGAYMSADTDEQKALIDKVFGSYDEFVVGTGSNEITLTVFADFHYKAGMYSTSISDLKVILKRADDSNSSFVLSAGDMTNDMKGSPELYNTFLGYVTEEGETLKAYNVYGNHELEASNTMQFVTPTLTNDVNVVWGDGTVGHDPADPTYGYYYVDVDGFRLVCVDNQYSWNPNHKNGVEVGWEHSLTGSWGSPSAANNAARGFDEGANAVANTKTGSLGDVQKAWLEAVLLDAAQKDIPCIINGHGGYSGLGFGGGTADAAEIREIYAKANAANPGTVIMSINGHIHTNNQGWNDGVFYFDVNTVRNNWWQQTAAAHYGDEHTYKFEEYDDQGNLIGITDKPLNSLTMASNTWFSEDPLSAVVTVNDAGIITIDGAESDWAYGIAPDVASAPSGTECKITSGTFWNCDHYGHVEEYVIDGANHYVKCNAYECGYTSAAVAHTFDQQVEEAQYNAGNANCNDPAKFYYSCVCGAAGTTTFESGTSMGHSPKPEWKFDGNTHWNECNNCTEKLNEAAHNFNQQVVNDAYKASDADCVNAATYYYSCVCGKAGTATFANGEADGHSPKTEWKSDSDTHWHECNNCTEKLNEAAHTGGEATCSAQAKCDVCQTAYGALDAANHDLKEVPEKGADHDEDGNIAHFKCNDCNKLFDDANATNELAPEDVVVDGGDHDFGEDYASDKDGHWQECDCGGKTDKADHTFGEWTVTSEASVETPGTKVRECSVCGFEEEGIIPATGDDSPETGDTFNPFVWAALLLISGSIFSLAVGYRRKRRA